jgi:hypothetical protein
MGGNMDSPFVVPKIRASAVVHSPGFPSGFFWIKIVLFAVFIDPLRC